MHRLALLLAVCSTQVAGAQVALDRTGVVVIDFNVLGAAAGGRLPDDVRVQTLAEARQIGTFDGGAQATVRRGGNRLPADAPAGAYNFGAGDSTGARDRAVGFVLGDGAGSGLVYLRLRNDTGGPLTRLTFGFDVEVYRRGTGTDLHRTFFSRDGTAFEPIGGGGSGTAQSSAPRDIEDAPQGGSGSFGTATGVPTVEPGGVFYLAWQFTAAEGSDPGAVGAVALDNVIVGADDAPFNVLVPDRLEREFGEVPTGSASEARPLAVQWTYGQITDASRPTVEVLGDADDFAVTATYTSVGTDVGFYGYEVVFQPGAEGERAAALVFSGPGVVADTVLLRGVGAPPTASAPDAPAADGLRVWFLGSNPTRTRVRLGLAATEPMTVDLDVFDAAGRRVWTARREVGPGQTPLDLDAAAWPGGLYLVRAQSGPYTATVPVTVVR